MVFGKHWSVSTASNIPLAVDGQACTVPAYPPLWASGTVQSAAGE